MQSVITWEQLFTALFFFLFIYYGFVFFVFYRHDFRVPGSILKKKSNSLAPYASTQTAEARTEETGGVLYNTALELMEDCKPLFREAAESGMSKEYLLDCVRLRVQKYPQIKGTGFQIAISNHIAQEVDNRLGVSLTDNEIESLWR